MTTPGDDIVGNISGYIPDSATEFHGIVKNQERDDTRGKRPIKEHIDEFIYWFYKANTIVGHNIRFDIDIITLSINKLLENPDLTNEDTVKYNTFLEKFTPLCAYCTLKHFRQYKKTTVSLSPETTGARLVDAHKILFGQDISGNLHNAHVDISVTLRIYVKITEDIDICNPMPKTFIVGDKINTNYDLCNIIKPVDLKSKMEKSEQESMPPLIFGINPELVKLKRLHQKTKYPLQL
jgi:DNA polymerase III epsilon subunit-like protein